MRRSYTEQLMGSSSGPPRPGPGGAGDAPHGLAPSGRVIGALRAGVQHDTHTSPEKHGGLVPFVHHRHTGGLNS